MHTARHRVVQKRMPRHTHTWKINGRENSHVTHLNHLLHFDINVTNTENVQDMQVVKISREQFDFVLPSLQWDRQRKNFVSSPVTTILLI